MIKKYLIEFFAFTFAMSVAAACVFGPEELMEMLSTHQTALLPAFGVLLTLFFILRLLISAFTAIAGIVIGIILLSYLVGPQINLASIAHVDYSSLSASGAGIGLLFLAKRLLSKIVMLAIAIPSVVAFGGWQYFG